MNVDKQVEYWREGSGEDLAAARDLWAAGHLRQSLFFAHLAMEKMLKALVVKKTGETPPKIHHLERLAQLACLEPGPDQRDALADFRFYHLAGRYPDTA